MHTTRWNPDVPLEGRRIAQIGTGASGAQLAAMFEAVGQTEAAYGGDDNFAASSTLAP